MASLNKKMNTLSDKQEVVSITYEEIGLFPRSFSRVLDRFLKQVFSDVENLVIQEYRFYRYLFLTTLKCLLILVFVPLFVNFVAKTYIVRPLTEYFWNTKQTEIFLNSYQQKHAFAELKDFEEKIYFESLIYPKSASLFTPSLITTSQTSEADSDLTKKQRYYQKSSMVLSKNLRFFEAKREKTVGFFEEEGDIKNRRFLKEPESLQKTAFLDKSKVTSFFAPYEGTERKSKKVDSIEETAEKQNADLFKNKRVGSPKEIHSAQPTGVQDSLKTNTSALLSSQSDEKAQGKSTKANRASTEGETTLVFNSNFSKGSEEEREKVEYFPLNSEEKAESFINSYTLKSSLFVYQTQEADKNIQQRYQEKTIELAQRYNDQSIEAITNFFADLISLISLFYLLYALEIQINITKSFLLEVFFGLDDSKKSLLILLITDLLVGYHSSNLWELFFEFLFHHYGLPESQTGIFLLVATLPVLLDVLFKYLIFRHLNRSSPATVATYHAMIE